MGFESKLSLAIFLFVFAVGAYFPVYSQNQAWKAPARAARKENPVSFDKRSVVAGKAVYDQGCLVCHGEQGKGDGPAGKDLETKPSDLTADRMKEETDGAIFWKISEGRAPMPGFEKILGEDQRWQVINYLRSLSSRVEEPPPEFSVPKDFQVQISEVLSSYLKIQMALAKDSFLEAQTQSKTTSVAIDLLAKKESKGLDEKATTAWADTVSALKKNADFLLSAQDLKSLRSAFKEISQTLAEVTAKFGNLEDNSLRLFHCPKAFDGAGAFWIQKEAEPQNPYFGSRMLHCGNLQKLIGKQKKEKGDER